MENEYAFAKLQNLDQQELFIRNIPLILRRKTIKETSTFQINSGNGAKEYPISMGIAKCSEISLQHAILFYNLKKKSFALIAFDKVFVNNQLAPIITDPFAFVNEMRKASHLDFFDKYDESTVLLNDFSQIYFPCEKCEIPHLFVIVLPASEVQKNESLNLKASSVYSHAHNQANPNNKIHDKLLYSKWSSDDREQLKKSIVNFGYGRWKQIQQSSFSIGGKLADRPKSEIRAFANAFIRSLAEQLNSQNSDLKQFLYNMVDEYPDDSYIAPSEKDWDNVMLTQRSIPFSKRLQLLYRIKVLIKKYRDDQLRGIPDKDKEKINWEGLLNFLLNSLLYGQRPSVWWTKKHDTDLLRGVYKYGYANYQTIRMAKEYCFSELEKTNMYQNFPSSDALTRRLKKLIQTILKSEEDKGKIDFDIQAESDDEEKGWSLQEKEVLFAYLMDNGVPLNHDGRSNWVEIRDKMKGTFTEITGTSVKPEEEQIPPTQEDEQQQQKVLQQNQQSEQQQQEQIQEQQQEQQQHLELQPPALEEGEKSVFRDFDKSISQIEKMVQRIRVKCQELLVQQKTQEDEDSQNAAIDVEEQIIPQNNVEEDRDEDGFTITLENAKMFNKKTNELHFLRKTIISNNQSLFQVSTDELTRRHELLQPEDPAYISNPNWIPKTHDLNLMMLLSTHGFSSLKNLEKYEQFDLYSLDVPEETLYNRLEWLCECFKEIKDRTINKKRKAEKNTNSFKDITTKKSKFEISRDEEGKIQFPIQINASLKLLATGKVCTLQTYHSEHNLFPIGFKSVRLHASIFNKGTRCEYINEILEGPEGKPLYRVTSVEDPDNPIVKESSTGCWVQICQKVNDLQDVKKEKVTISGTERYGLIESNVIRLLEDLPDVEHCARYKFKFKNVIRSSEDLE